MGGFKDGVPPGPLGGLGNRNRHRGKARDHRLLDWAPRVSVARPHRATGDYRSDYRQPRWLSAPAPTRPREHSVPLGVNPPLYPTFVNKLDEDKFVMHYYDSPSS